MLTPTLRLMCITATDGLYQPLDTYVRKCLCYLIYRVSICTCSRCSIQDNTFRWFNTHFFIIFRMGQWKLNRFLTTIYHELASLLDLMELSLQKNYSIVAEKNTYLCCRLAFTLACCFPTLISCIC